MKPNIPFLLLGPISNLPSPKRLAPNIISLVPIKSPLRTLRTKWLNFTQLTATLPRRSTPKPSGGVARFPASLSTFSPRGSAKPEGGSLPFVYRGGCYPPWNPEGDTLVYSTPPEFPFFFLAGVSAALR